MRNSSAPLLWEPEPCLRDPALSARYSALADDSGTSARQREAAVLLCAAQSHLDGDEDTEEAQCAALGALQLFRQLNDQRGSVDALRHIIHSLCARAHRACVWDEVCREGADGARLAQEAWQEAEELARSELSAFREQGDRIGEAAMLLSVSQVLGCRVRYLGKHEYQWEALRTATAAREMAEEIGDKTLQAGALLELVSLHHLRQEVRSAIQAGDELVRLCQELKDRKLEGKAWHQLAIARHGADMFPEAMKALRVSLSIFRELGLRRLEALELHAIGEFHLDQGQIAAVLPVAREAVEVFKELSREGGRSHRVYAVRAQTQLLCAHALLGETERATRLADSQVEECQRVGDKRSELVALNGLIDVLVISSRQDGGHVETALERAKQALALSRALPDQQWEARMLQRTGCLHLELHHFRKAEQAMHEAQALFDELGDKSNEAAVSNNLADLHFVQSEYRKASWAAEEERELFEQTGERGKEAQAMLKMAEAKFKLGDSKEAGKLAQQARHVCAGIGEPHGEASALMLSSQMLAFKSKSPKLAEAAKAAGEAAGLYRKSRAWKQEAGALLVVARLLLHLRQPLEAVKRAEEVCILTRRKKDGAPLAIQGLCTLARAKLEIHMKGRSRGRACDVGVSKLLRPAKEAVGLASQAPTPSGSLGCALFVLADILLTIGRQSEALEPARKAVEQYRECGDQLGQVAAMFVFAEAYFECGLLRRARQLVHESLLLASECGDASASERGEELLAYFGDRAPGAGRPRDLQALAAAQQQDELDRQASASAASTATAKRGLDPQMVRELVVQIAHGQVPVDTDEFPMDDPLMDLGMDSLSSVSFRNELSRRLQMRLSSSVTFDYPTVRHIIDHVVEESQEVDD